MLLAGVDEAGYGPILGPLTVGCCVIDVPSTDGEVPCAWKLLRRIAGKSRDKNGRKLHINDSKKVYSPSTGLSELERSVLVLLGLANQSVPATLDEMLSRLVPDCVRDLSKIPWYQPPASETFPCECEAMAIKLMLNAARAEFVRAGVRIVSMSAFAVDERRLNHMFDATKNKSATSFYFVSTHLDRLLKAHAHENEFVIYCDRQGGKEHYGHDLRRAFEEWHLEITAEKPERAEYRLTNGDRAARLIFAEKGEGECMAVAIASMVAKYLREALMGRFNAYWKQHAPAVNPTAGYWQDGLRFLKDIAPACAAIGVEQSVLMRSR